VPAGRTAVGLLEFLEDAGLRVCCDADAGVAHPETSPCRARFPARPDRDPACFGELHGIAGQVHPAPAQPRPVADHLGRQPVVDQRRDLDLLGVGARRQQFDRFLDQRREPERAGIEASLPASILEKSKISPISDSKVSPEVFTALT